MDNFNTINTLQRWVLSAVAAVTLLGLSACCEMPSQDKNATSGGIIGDEVGKYKH
jgi:hypothetical protein